MRIEITLAMKRVRRLAGLLFFGFALASCAELGLSRSESMVPKPSAAAGDTSPLEPGRSRPASAPEAGTADARQSSPSPRPLEPRIYRGTGAFVNQAAPVQSTAVNEEGDITLNFVNDDIRDVVRLVLGDILKLDFAVEAGVQGTVTMRTSRPLAREQVLPALEEALRLQGFALVQSGGLYKVVSAQEAPRQSGPPTIGAGLRRPGFGVEIVPLRYVSPGEIQRALEPLVPAGGILQADTRRNLLLIGGTESQRAMLVAQIRTFDVDWLAGMSFGLFPLSVAPAKTVIAELDEIIGGSGGPLGGVVRLIPIERMNAVLAISPQASYLEQVRIWVERLDRANEAVDRQIYVYYVQNGRATDIAAVLTRVMTGDSRGSDAAPSRQADAAGIATPQAITGAPLGAPRGLTGSGGTRALQEPMSPPGGAPPSSTITDAGTSGGGGSEKGFRITADESNNALVILATAAEYASVEAALRKLDIIPLQVLLEASIAEVTLTKELRYGVQYFFQIGNHQIVRTDTNTSNITPNFPGFAYVFSSGNDIQVILSALESVTDVNVVSSPQVFVLNNQTATLQVGDQVPVATQSAVSILNPGSPIVNTISFRDTGVILKVTPRVNEGGLVVLDISQEVSDVTRTTSSTIDSPTIQQRKISSSIAIQDGETVALGGLIKDNRNKGKSGIPVLKDIPVLGNLFSSTDNSTTRTELLVLITPRVVENPRKARAITEELQRKVPATRPAFDRVR